MTGISIQAGRSAQCEAKGAGTPPAPVHIAGVLDGKKVAAKVIQEVRARSEKFLKEFVRRPGLAVVQVGDDAASSVYVRNKRKACIEAGIESFAYDLPPSTSEEQLLSLIGELNSDSRVDGILVQLPIPGVADASHIMDCIDPAKDVDGFHPVNTGLLSQKRPRLRPCTPLGIIRLANEYNISLRGARATVLGASNIVGRPMALELLLAGATVTVCHSRTRDIRSEVERADVLVVAVGQADFVPGEWITKGAIVFDVGINRVDSGGLVGDVEYDEASKRAAWITPVPGGVGPMTIAMLLSNTLDAAFMMASVNASSV